MMKASRMHCGALWCWLSAAAAISSGEGSGDQRVPAEHSTFDIGQVQVGARIPLPIAIEDEARFARYLQFSQEQGHFYEGLYHVYLQNFADLVRRERAETLEKQSAAAKTVLEGRRDWQAAGAIESHIVRTDEVRRRISELDELLFSRLESGLTSEQIAGMWRVRNFRVRQVSDVMRRTWPAAQVDVSMLVEMMCDTDVDTLAVLDTELVTYERKVTGYIDRFDELDRETIVTLAWARARRDYDEHGQGVSDEGVRRMNQTRVDGVYAGAIAEAADQLAAIVALNAETVERLAALLDEGSRSRLQDEYRMRAWPLLYLERERPDELLTQILADGTMPPAQHEVLREAREDFERQRRQICDEMEAVSNAMHERLCRTHSRSKGYEQMRDNLRALREKRWKLYVDIAHRMKGMMGGEQDRWLQELEQFAARVRDEMKTGEVDAFPGL